MTEPPPSAHPNTLDRLEQYRQLLSPAEAARLVAALERPRIPAIRVNTLKIGVDEARRSWPDILEQDQNIADDSPSASQMLDRKALAQAVWEKVNQLPKLWSVAIILFYREEKSITEIAEIMNINDNTVKTYLFRGKKALSATLERYYEGKSND